MQTIRLTLGLGQDRLQLTFLRLNVVRTRNVFRQFNQHAKSAVTE